MKLVPFSAQYLRLNQPLPFSLHDAEGHQLLAAGLAVESEERLAELHGQPLFGEENEFADWLERASAAKDQAQRRRVARSAVITAPREAGPPAPPNLPELWSELAEQLDAALAEARAGTDWRSRLFGVHGRARQLYQRWPDAALYLLVYTAGHSTQKYSANHSLLTLLMCEQAAGHLGWSQSTIDSLGRAALTMNVAMLELQNQLAGSDHPLSPEVRAEISAHPARGAQLLQEAGLADPLCLEVVRLHHDARGAQEPLVELPPERQLARLLRRVDIFAAKISRRAKRPPMSPVQAAREACLGTGGVPDEIGSALLKAVGIYPPGSFVELVSGELGIVVARGRSANRPYVASLVSGVGAPMAVPELRDTLNRRHTVKGAVAAWRVKLRPPHEQLLTLR